MNEPGRHDVRVQPLVGGRSRRGAWLAAGIVAAVLVAVVALGRFGPPGAGEARPRSTAGAVAPTPGTTRAAASVTPQPIAAPTPRPTATIASGQPAPVGTAAPRASGDDRVYVARGMGYQVRRSDAGPEAIAESFDDRTVAFVYARVSLASRGYGTIQVAVGTPGQGGTLPGPLGDLQVYGDTLASLLANFSSQVGVTVDAVAPYPLGGEPGRLLDVTLAFDGAQRAVAMAVHGRRAYIVAADGFDTGVPATSRVVRRQALLEFLDRFAFLGPPLYVSDDLQFEVPLITDRQPAGLTIAFASERYGHLTFFDGTASTSIRVDVGTSTHPARPPVAGPAPPAGASFWAPDVAALAVRFLMSYESGFGSRTHVGGEPAIRVERPGDIGVAVLVAHAGRVYVISSTGGSGPDVSPSFDDFLRGFRFLERAPATAPPAPAP